MAGQTCRSSWMPGIWFWAARSPSSLSCLPPLCSSACLWVWWSSTLRWGGAPKDWVGGCWLSVAGGSSLSHLAPEVDGRGPGGPSLYQCNPSPWALPPDGGQQDRHLGGHCSCSWLLELEAGPVRGSSCWGAWVAVGDWGRGEVGIGHRESPASYLHPPAL